MLHFVGQLLISNPLEKLLGLDDTLPKPISSVEVKYVEYLERHAQIIYPALALLVLALIGFAIASTWRRDDLDSAARETYRREVLAELRRNLAGLSTDKLAREMGLPRLKMVKLLEEMQREGMLDSRTNKNRLLIWQVKGIRT